MSTAILFPRRVKVPRKYFIYNIEAGEYFEYLLIASVATLLGIRFYLTITGFPQVGGGGLHIAHMLWGGLLMLFSIIFLFTFLNRSWLKFIAILAGIGFGTFIDELGKFITSDNNYFFEPTFAIIYIIFIVLFLIFRFFEKTHKLSQTEYLSNLFEITRQIVTEKADSKTKAEAEQLLAKCDPGNSAVQNLSNILGRSYFEENQNVNLLAKIRAKASLWYAQILKSNLFTKGFVVFFAIFALFNLWQAADVVSLYFRLENFELSFIDSGKFFSSLISSIIVLCGIITMRFSQLKGHKLIKIGVLFSLFITQFFNFYNDQLFAAGIFTLNIFLLLNLNYIIKLKSLNLRVDKRQES